MESQGVLLVETLMRLSTLLFSELDDPGLDAREAAELDAKEPLERLRLFRGGYIARRAGSTVDVCPVPVVEGDQRGMRLRATWILGWTLRDLAEVAEDRGVSLISAAMLAEFDKHKVVQNATLVSSLSMRLRLDRALGAASRWKRLAKELRLALANACESEAWARRIRPWTAKAMITEFLRAAGTKTLVEWKYHLKDARGAFVMTMARVDGPTAIDLINEQKSRAETAEARVRELEQFLASKG
ncbi:hypothetical protein EKK58_05600 [Candidatus Dependentiae bacterium]|nr:MAG: hypothetical protein EKK58_05600 [Candidatus Dependentiae bacterium]